MMAVRTSWAVMLFIGIASAVSFLDAAEPPVRIPAEQLLAKAAASVGASKPDHKSARATIWELRRLYGNQPLLNAYDTHPRLQTIILDIITANSKGYAPKSSVGLWAAKRILASQSPRRQRELLKVVAMCGTAKDVAAAYPFLTHKYVAHRKQGIATIAALGGLTESRRILPLLNDPESRVRLLAAQTLGRLGNRAAIPNLRKRLRGEPFGTQSYVLIAESLARLGDRQGHQALQRCLTSTKVESPRGYIWTTSLLALGAVGDRHTIPAIIAFMREAAKSNGQYREMLAQGSQFNPVWSASWSLCRLTGFPQRFTMAQCLDKPAAVIAFWQKWWQKYGQQKRETWPTVKYAKPKRPSGFRVRAPVCVPIHAPTTVDCVEVPAGAVLSWQVRRVGKAEQPIPGIFQSINIRPGSHETIVVTAIAKREGKEVGRASRTIYPISMSAVDRRGKGLSLPIIGFPRKPITVAIRFGSAEPIKGMTICWDVGRVPMPRTRYLAFAQQTIPRHGIQPIGFSVRHINDERYVYPGESGKGGAAPKGIAPTVISQPESFIGKEEQFAYTIILSETAKGKLTYTIERGPEGMRIDNQGQLVWIPQQQDLGSHTVIILIRLPDGTVVRHEFEITVESEEELQPANTTEGPPDVF